MIFSDFRAFFYRFFSRVEWNFYLFFFFILFGSNAESIWIHGLLMATIKEKLCNRRKLADNVSPDNRGQLIWCNYSGLSDRSGDCIFWLNLYLECAECSVLPPQRIDGILLDLQQLRRHFNEPNGNGNGASPLEWRKIAPIPRKRGADPLVTLLIDIGSLVCDIKQFHAQIETDICSGQIYGTK